MATTIAALTERVLQFRNERDWKQFHSPKDMILSLMLEASELAEHCQWKSKEEFFHHLEEQRGDVADELADILYWVLLISSDFGIDLENHFETKMTKNEEKYPVAKSRGSAVKYDELE